MLRERAFAMLHALCKTRLKLGLMEAERAKVKGAQLGDIDPQIRPCCVVDGPQLAKARVNFVGDGRMDTRHFEEVLGQHEHTLVQRGDVRVCPLLGLGLVTKLCNTGVGLGNQGVDVDVVFANGRESIGVNSSP